MNPLREIIASEIRLEGAISFARFMELALYCPDYGYYEKESDTIGRRGDFFTSVSVGILFGQLLAFQFAEWLSQEERSGFGVQDSGSSMSNAQCSMLNVQYSESPESDALQVVEAGAHDGQLAKDILEWIRDYRPQLFQRLEYWIVEPSQRRQQKQAQMLRDFRQTVHWTTSLSAAPPAARHPSITPSLHHSTTPLPQSSLSPCPIGGVIFANELLDAFPVHRYFWDAQGQQWSEWGVGLEQDRFVWRRLPLGPETLDFGLKTLGSTLPDGFTVELCPAAQEWWQTAAKSLAWGKLMTIDYALSAEEWLERTQGTLRAYHHHRLSPDLLANPGKQDLTAHVNFPAIQSAGEAAGLTTETMQAQSQWLTQIASRIWEQPEGFDPWTEAQTRQFQTLTHPEHLGRTFRVLVQGRERKANEL